MTKDWQRLARAIRDYRDQTGLTHDVITANGGPSSPTITKLEAGEPTKNFVLERLDAGLGWGSGMALRLINGEDVPVRVRPTIDHTPAAEMPRRRVSDTELIAMLAERLTELREEVEALRDRSQPSAIEPTPYNRRLRPTTSSDTYDPQKHAASHGEVEPSMYDQTVSDDE